MVHARADGLEQKPHRLAADLDEAFHAQHVFLFSGGRDALMQERALSALLAYRDPAAPGFMATRNPVSAVYGGRMIDVAWSHVWAWDARPFPAFPLMTDVWSDGGNWETGHWLNGRLGALSLA